MLKPNSEVTANLIKARELIADESKWCQHTLFDGERRCAIGALMNLGLPQFREAEGVLQKAAAQMYPEIAELGIITPMQGVNDFAGHTAVMKVFDRAIELSLQD